MLHHDWPVTTFLGNRKLKSTPFNYQGLHLHFRDSTLGRLIVARAVSSCALSRGTPSRRTYGKVWGGGCWHRPQIWVSEQSSANRDHVYNTIEVPCATENFHTAIVCVLCSLTPYHCNCGMNIQSTRTGRLRC